MNRGKWNNLAKAVAGARSHEVRDLSRAVADFLSEEYRETGIEFDPEKIVHAVEGWASTRRQIVETEN